MFRQKFLFSSFLKNSTLSNLKYLSPVKWSAFSASLAQARSFLDVLDAYWLEVNRLRLQSARRFTKRSPNYSSSRLCCCLRNWQTKPIMWNKQDLHITSAFPSSLLHTQPIQHIVHLHADTLRMGLSVKSQQTLQQKEIWSVSSSHFIVFIINSWSAVH